MTKSKGKATVVAKVIRADGTEETYVSEDVTVTDADALAKTLSKIDKEND